MTPEEWLAENGKKPYGMSWEDGGEDRWFYWGTMDDYDPNDPDNDPDEEDFLLPPEIFAKLKERTTYPNVKMYDTKQEAMDDFCQAFAQVFG